MSEAPKSIWVWEHTDPETGKPFGYGEWYTEDVGLDGDETEYVRCDELDRLRAENERLREALIDAVDVLSGATFEVMRVRGQYIDRKDVVCRARAALQTKGDER